MFTGTLWISLLLAVAILVVDLPAQSIERYGVVEIELRNDSPYNHPIRDVQIDAVFTAPDGSRRGMGGFWDGSDRYLVRFAPDQVGRWTWETICSDTLNRNLHGKRGEFDVLPYTGDDPYRSKGWIRSNPGKHYLEYADGDPFFYLGCTAWEMSWRSYSFETDIYFSDRRRKGYNAVQMVVMSHRQIEEFGVVNRNGDSTFVGWDQSRLNPEYFRYLDSLIMKANDSGLMVTLVPLWADLAKVQHGSFAHRFPFSVEDGLALARYTAARFGGYNVMWIIAGDATYRTPEQQVFWNDFARIIDSVSGGNHLLTVHTSGWDASWNYFDNDTPWLDFHTYHSSHLADNDYQWQGALEGFDREPTRPIVNGEQVYEDIFNNFSPDSARIDRRYVRQAAWESFLSGALVGVVYGANSIWQWHNGTYAFEAHSPRVNVLEAIDFPGSSDIVMVRTIMSRFPWWKIVPRPDLVVEKRDRIYIPCGVADSLAFIYVWNNTGPATVNLEILGDTVRTTWINPVTGIETPADSYVGDLRRSIRVETPDTNDWLLVARGANYREPAPPDDDTGTTEPLVEVDVSAVGRELIVRISTPTDGSISVELVDMLGRNLGRVEASVVRGFSLVRVPVPDPGAYFVTLHLNYAEGQEVVRTFKRAVP